MTATTVEEPIVCAETTVVAAEPLGESFVRLVLAGRDLARWSGALMAGGTAGDAYVKLLIPPPGGGRDGSGLGVTPDAADVRGWLALPEAERGWMRTYTVRRSGTTVGDGAAMPSITVDVVVHPGAEEGPGSAWARGTRVGDRIRVLGPGLGHAPWAAWAPGEAARVVCAGDETAAPALLAIAEELAAEPAGAREVRILVEVPTAADARALAADARSRAPGSPGIVSVLARGGVPGEALARRLSWEFGLGEAAVETVLAGHRPAERDWQPASEAGGDDPYVFLAGEAGLVRAMRRLCVDAAAIPREAVAFMGYWRRGSAES